MKIKYLCSALASACGVLVCIISLNCKSTLPFQGPFDGILSFSQGAAFASLLCGVQEQNQGSPIKFSFVILIAGFKSRQSSHQSLYSSPITIPSLHVFGDTDKVISKGR